MEAQVTVSILFVCLGNICRSPLAETALRHEAEKAGIDVHVDSAGTGDWHVGQPPDRRALAVARRQGIDMKHLRGRQVDPEDFHRFDHIVAMDETNLEDLQLLRPPGSRAELSLLLDHVAGREGQAVADPYYGSASDFDTTWTDVVAGARGLLDRIRAQG